MRLWRISNYETLDGFGGLRASGRWHNKGRRILYCATHPATALLEMLVHLELDIEDMPDTYRLLEINVPDAISNETIDRSILKADWRTTLQSTRAIGDAWLSETRTALLIVPSAIVPADNVLLNPLHPQASEASIVSIISHPLDARLL